MRMSRTELHDRIELQFAAQPPRTDEVRQAFDAVAAQFETLAHFLVDLLPEGRSLELVIEQLTSTKREAIAAIACYQDDFMGDVRADEAYVNLLLTKYGLTR